jgi:alpha-L-rhamnosidase
MNIRVKSVRAELRTDSDDIATPTPRLSWTTLSEAPEWTQLRAELRLDDGSRAIVEGAESVLVPWPFPPLAPRERRRLQVRVSGTDGSASEWSDPLLVRAAFLADGEWAAEMITLPQPSRIAQPALFRTEFEATRPVREATLYATAQGVYQAFVNGEAVDDEVLKPGWTPYRSRLVHESSDVTHLIRPGANAIGVSLAGGWYTEKFGFRPDSVPYYGEQPAVAVQLVLTFDDGSTRVIVSDESWRATGDGPVESASIYDGEEYDARREMPGWNDIGFDASAWERAAERECTVRPGARTAPAVRVIEEVPVATTLESAGGEQILDFGQNLVGRLRITVDGPAGTVVTLRHAEVLEHGELGVRPLRLAKATDRYVLAGDGPRTWQPDFTFHGFRYAQISGLPAPIDPTSVTAEVVHSDMRRTGTFESSSALLNKLHENVVWGMRGNFLYVPTDCPQRDERLGWTGDLQVFAPTASYLYDADGFLTSWLTDLALEQGAAGTGSVPFIVPAVLADAATPAAAWGDAATVVPWVLYERYGDRAILERQLDSMRAWVDTLRSIAGESLLWSGGFQFGDWLDPTAPPEDAAKAQTSPDIVATAYFYRSAFLTARAAGVLGRDDVAADHGRLADGIRAAFLGAYVLDDGAMSSDAQTAYALAIAFGLADSTEQEARFGERLASLVRGNGFHIGTGFVGTPLVTEALTRTGHLDVAAKLLTETGNPSWLYPVTMGATTIWERWDSMLPDGSINPGEMTSFNHYAFGAVADWMHRTVAGLAPAEPGYRSIRIAPRPIAELDHAAASLETPYGFARVSWRREGDAILVDAEVPANARAVVSLPGSDEFVVGAGRHEWRC